MTASLKKWPETIKKNFFIVLGASMIESMWSSMTTSLQLAEDCMKKERDISSDSGNQAFEGIESFAHTIDSSTHYFKKYFFFY